MSALAASAVTLNNAWKGEGTSSRLFLFKDVTLVLTGQGGLTNSIDASTLGFQSILGVRSARDSNSVQVTCGPSYDGSKVVLFKAASPTPTSYVVTGRNGAGSLTVTGIATTDTIVAVVNIGGLAAWAVGGEIALSEFSIASANTVTQASATDYSGAKLQFLTIPTAALVASGTPTDVTATVRLTVFGYDTK